MIIGFIALQIAWSPVSPVVVWGECGAGSNCGCVVVHVVGKSTVLHKINK